jgi:N-acetylneuraminate synthase
MVRIIGEIGLNHVGSLDTARKLATMARDAGCDLVKLQKRDVDFCYSPEELAKPCDSPWGTTLRDKVEGRELSWSDIDSFNAHCHGIGIGWFASCFDFSSLKELHRRYPSRPYNKVPSCMATRREFLEAVARQGVPTLVSTGHFPSVHDAVGMIGGIFGQFNCPFGLLHTTALYPAPINRLNLRRIRWLDDDMREADCDPSLYLGVGYSGHEVGVSTSVLAASLGAKWIERHITLDRASYGADQAASLEPDGLRRLVRDIRQIDEAMGDPDPALVGDEKVPVTFWREI